jgi:hypothetical protein
MTDISKTSAPWWESSLPPFASPPQRDEFYDDVATLRCEKYGARPTAGLLKGKDLLVSFCLVVESMGLDKHAAGKFCRLFKLVASYDQFKAKVAEGLRPLATDLLFVLDHFEKDDQMEMIRQALLPTRAVKLSTPQIQGYNLLQVLERDRQRVLADYEGKERSLQRQLRELRAERDEFGRQLAIVIPQWANVKRARDTTVSRIEREGLVARFEASKDLQSRYTLEGYLATARANKVQDVEQQTYDSFRRLDTASVVHARVQEARARAAGGTAEGAEGEQEVSEDPLVFAPQ